MTEEEFIELLAEQGTTISFHPVKDGPWVSNTQSEDLYQVSLFGWHMQEFDTQDDAEEYKKTLKDFAKKNMLNTLFNKRLSDALHKEHQNSETNIAIERQKTLMGKR
jgi:hypothetical protein